jgi:hypothetical protein
MLAPLDDHYSALPRRKADKCRPLSSQRSHQHTQAYKHVCPPYLHIHTLADDVYAWSSYPCSHARIICALWKRSRKNTAQIIFSERDYYYYSPAQRDNLQQQQWAAAAAPFDFIIRRGKWKATPVLSYNTILFDGVTTPAQLDDAKTRARALYKVKRLNLHGDQISLAYYFRVATTTAKYATWADKQYQKVILVELKGAISCSWNLYFVSLSPSRAKGRCTDSVTNSYVFCSKVSF